jgi:hypothetical protein
MEIRGPGTIPISTEELSEADKHLLYGFLLRKIRARVLQTRVLRVIRSPLELDTKIQSLLKISGPGHPFPRTRNVVPGPWRARTRAAVLVIDGRTEIIGLRKKCALKREVSFLRTADRFDAVVLIPRHDVRLVILNETLPTETEYARYFEICRAIMPGIRILCLGAPARLLAEGSAGAGAVRFLPRPFNIDAVEQSVRELLGEPQR